MAIKPGQPDSNKPAAQSAPAQPKAVPLTAELAPAPAQATGQQAMVSQSNFGGEEHDYDEEEEGDEFSNNFLWFNAVPSWMTSMVVHMVALLILAFLTFTAPGRSQRAELVIDKTEEVEEMEDFEEEKLENIDMEKVDMNDEIVEQETEELSEVPIETPAMDIDAAMATVELVDASDRTAPRSDLLNEIGVFTGTGLEGRGHAQRGRLVAEGGGTPGSEAAVARALEWFANHQNSDGSWDFDHTRGECQGRCGNPGSLAGNAKLGATAMALLPFLGAGNTHQQGKYKDNVQAGLYYLVSHMKVEGQRGSLADAGRMYSHGLATIALCEAYGMTQDRGLEDPAQLAINYIVYAQDPVGGGWRYTPQQAGDTSVVGWQLMALKSAHMAYLHVPEETIRGAVKFLDSVQSGDYGSRYGYTGPGERTANTSIGLLCRMYLGWKHEHPGLQDGVAFLSRTGPSAGDMYYNYYATQVMRHYGGEEWERWNGVMRDQLVNSQAMEGHARGSWHQGGDHGSRSGGRHYVTSMSCMILEVYYRHLPLYQQQAAEEDFPL